MNELPLDRAGQRAFPILVVGVAMLAMLFDTKHGLARPPLIWASWTVLCYGCLPFAAALALDGWRRPIGRLYAALALLAALTPLVWVSWVSGGRALFQGEPRWLLGSIAVCVAVVILGAVHGRVDLRRWGAGLGDWRWWVPRTGLAVLGCFALVAVWFWVDPAMAAYYPAHASARESLGGLPFCLLHRGKPETEMLGSFVVGCLLSWFCLRGRSLWPGVILHAALNLSVQIAGFVLRS